MRVFRVFRVMKALHQLQMIESARQLFLLLSALIPICRVWLLMVPVLWVFALFLTEFGYDMWYEGYETKNDWFDAMTYFGSMGQSLTTLFIACTRDHWTTVSR